MSVLGNIVQAVEAHDQFVDAQADRAGHDAQFAGDLKDRWQSIRQSIQTVRTPAGLEVPRLALPTENDPPAIARYLFGEGLPGEFPFVNSIYREMYLDAPANGQEEPTRLFAGLELAEDTNRRFHFIARQQHHVRLSTAFDGPTLYGMDSDDPAVFSKIGEGGVAIDTIDDMNRLYRGFDLDDPHFSVSMTINGPAPVLLAMYLASARRRFGDDVTPKLRGTVQADVLKEVQAQNEMILPLEPALRLLADMAEFTTKYMPRWYPISISGYHIAEAGATPVQQAAFTLSNGFTYVELLRQRGLEIDTFGPRLSFFLDCGLDLEYLVLGRVCRKIWAIAMRDVFAGGEPAQRFKLHIQTSGRTLIARAFQNNLTRTAVELMLAYMNSANSCHSNSADEPFTTPSEAYVRLAASSQAILLEETGLLKFMMNALSGSPGMKIVEAAVQKQILDEIRKLDSLGGVLSAIEYRYQRSQIQSAAHRYEQQIHGGQRPIVGLNRYADDADAAPPMAVMRTSAIKKRRQVERLRKFKQKNRRLAPEALDRLSAAIDKGDNLFAELIRTVEHCSLGQITGRLQEHFGRFRPMV